ncbi:hypothetical protein PT974_02029 [Cladobotryum mycophilum]|uniref:RRM domain-containing protein n=1 Tax=Cladobotryum mycophilum TaxID=491253 RepID=A0ABR0SX22_9HYPO
MDSGFGIWRPSGSGSNMFNMSHFRLSPGISSDEYVSPQTPQNSCDGFDEDVGIATPPSGYGSAILLDHTCQQDDPDTFPISPIGVELHNHMQAASNVWPLHSTSQAWDISRIWDNPTPPPLNQDQSAYMRWMALDDMNTRNGLQAGAKLPPPQYQRPNSGSFTPDHRPNPNLTALNVNAWALASQESFTAGLGFVDNHNAQARRPAVQANYTRPFTPHSPRDRIIILFQTMLPREPTESLKMLLNLPTVFWNLGVDTLRISQFNEPSAQQFILPTSCLREGLYSPSDDYPARLPAQRQRRQQQQQLFPPPPPPPPPPSPPPSPPTYVGQYINGPGFTPMHAVHGQTHTPSGRNGLATGEMSSKFSTKYHGMHTEANASAEYLSPNQNCALWLTNLPPDITHHQLLGAIRNVGRIWCSFINTPDYVTHHTAAAKVVFFSPKSAQQLLSSSWTKGLFIGNFRVRVAHNRIKSESREDELSTPKSRVLIICGQTEFINEAYLTKYFKDRFIFQNDQVSELIITGGRSIMEWRFGSYRCQSQMGKMSLEKDRPFWLEKVEFGQDPCEVGDTLSSYITAADRIRGIGL